MKETYKDFKIEATALEHPIYGRGVNTTFYLPKNDGTKSAVYIIASFDDKRIAGAIENAKTIIDALYYTHARAK